MNETSRICLTFDWAKLYFTLKEFGFDYLRKMSENILLTPFLFLHQFFMFILLPIICYNILKVSNLKGKVSTLEISCRNFNHPYFQGRLFLSVVILEQKTQQHVPYSLKTKLLKKIDRFGVQLSFRELFSRSFVNVLFLYWVERLPSVLKNIYKTIDAATLRTI